MAIDQASITEFLQRQHLFKNLNSEQLTTNAVNFTPITFAKNAVVYMQGNRGDSFYIIYKGKINLIIEEEGQEHNSGTLTSGDYFGEESILFNNPRSTSAVAAEPTIVLHLSRQHFLDLIEKLPQVKRLISATVESRRIARNKKFNWVNEDEIIYLISQKHWFFLVLGLVIPLILLLLSIPILVVGWVDNTITLSPAIVRIIGLLLALFGFSWGIWNWIDWGNDYYIVTNQRILWLEKIIALYDSSNEIPLDSILSVGTSSSQLGRIFGYGSVNLRTYTGGILLQKMDQPGQFGSIVEWIHQIQMKKSEEEELEEITRIVQQALREGKNPYDLVAQSEKLQSTTPKITKLTTTDKSAENDGRFTRWLSNLLKVRYVDGGIITYRKHWFALFKKAWASTLSLIILSVITIVLIWLQYSKNISFTTELPYYAIIFILGLIIVLWLGYNYLDWSNDIYRLTPDQIIDIEKKPLGREEKKTANLIDILSVEHERASLLNILLNFGTVTINVGQTKFLFYNVFNPNQVHQDIADYREAMSRTKRAEEKKREHRRMVNWLLAYNKEFESQQENEQELEDNEYSASL